MSRQSPHPILSTHSEYSLSHFPDEKPDRHLCLSVALLFGCTGVCKSADFQKGVTAYQSGDYATALREWTPLAKQGDAEGSQTGRAIYPHASDSELFLIGISQLELFR